MKPPEVSHFRGLQALAQFRQRILYFRRHFGIDLAQQTESMLRNQPEWEVVTPTQLAIVKFCYAPQGLTPPSNRTNYFSAHDGGRLCLRADHPAERPDRSADLPDPPGDNGGRYPPYDTAYVLICPCAEKGTCAELFLNYMP